MNQLRDKTTVFYHYDQQNLYELFLQFMREGSIGIEVTEQDCVEAFKAARAKTGYFLERSKK